MNNKSRLIWRCRRGMREMDILLETFIEKEYDNLTLDQQRCFENFLNETDADIYSWMTGNKNTEENSYKYFIQHLQNIQI